MSLVVILFFLFYSAILLKIFKTFHVFPLKISLNLLIILNLLLLNTPISSENRWGIYFIHLFYLFFLWSWLHRPNKKIVKLQNWSPRRRGKSEEVYKSIIASHCWSYNHRFDFGKANIIPYSTSFSHLDFHEVFYIFKNSKNFLILPYFHSLTPGNFLFNVFLHVPLSLFYFYLFIIICYSPLFFFP